jgi:hypothetical protein
MCTLSSVVYNPDKAQSFGCGCLDVSCCLQMLGMGWMPGWQNSSLAGPRFVVILV